MGAKDFCVSPTHPVQVWPQPLNVTSLLSTVSAPDMTSYWRQVLQGLEPNELVISLAVTYSLEIDTHDEPQISIIRLQGALGVDEGHLLARTH